jgi:hypothetical protein
MQNIHRTRFFIRTSCSRKTVILLIYNDAGNLRNVAAKRKMGIRFLLLASRPQAKTFAHREKVPEGRMRGPKASMQNL